MGLRLADIVRPPGLKFGARPAESHAQAASCANCDAPLSGAYCYACGQKAAGPEVSLHDFFHEAFHEFAHVDGKIVQTLKLLFARPGALTVEFLAGRRARYVSPLRLYLTCSLVFFALAAVAPIDERPFFTITRNANSGFNQSTPEQQLRDATIRANRAIVHAFPRVMFGLMPAFGLMTWALYRRTRRFYAAHLYYSIHFHAFAFLALTLSVLLRLSGGRYGSTLGSAVVFVIWAYHYASLHRVFGGSRLQTAWKGTLLWVTYLVLITAAVFALGLSAIAGGDHG